MWGVLVVVAIGLSGCTGGGSVPKADVSGTVTLNGQPLADADVHFVNEESGFAGYGRTDSQGKYTLVQGAAIGTNKVFFSKKETSGDYDPDPEAGMDDGQFEAAVGFDEGEAAMPGVARGGEQIPPPYTGENSKLTYEVPAGGANDADFKLTGSN